MPYILAALGVLGAIAYFIIRAHHVSRAGRELIETAHEVKGFVRRSRWQRKMSKNKGGTIDDPRVVATAIMCAVARVRGDISLGQKEEILNNLSDRLLVDPRDCQDMLDHSLWLASDLGDLNAFLARALKPVQDRCSPEEMQELIEMVRQVASHEGEPSDHQKDGLNFLTQRLNLA